MKVKQSIPKELRFTVEDFNRRFPTDASCLDALMQKRFPEGITYCTKCKQDRRHYRVAGRPAYGCGHCGTQVSPMAGTIFEHSSTSLRLWYYAIYLMTSTRCGISAKQVQRETGVTYKTAWRMFKQIRSLLSEPDMQLGGLSVEMDETGIGGTTTRSHRAVKPKTTVFGMVERGGRVKAVVADNRKKKL
jgi:transposase